MKKKLLTLVFPLMAFACLFTACSDDDDLGSGQPIMPITYSLPAQMKVDTEDYEPVLIKTEAEFDAFFSDYKDQMGWVDFNKYDFVYGQGGSSHGVVNFESRIDGTEPPYRLVVHIQQNLTHEYVRWAVAYLLPKYERNQVTMAVSIEMAEETAPNE